MASPFFLNVVATTKHSLQRETKLQKDSEVVHGIVERRIKKLIMDNASKGFTTVEVDLKHIGNIDIVSKYCINDILFTKVNPMYVPVVDRLLASPDFADFQIGNTETGVYIFDWTHALLKEETPPAPASVKATAAVPVDTTAPAPAQETTQAWQPGVLFANTYPSYNSVDPAKPASDAEVEELLSALFPYLMGAVNTV
jgi:hypothetical protein